MTALRLLGNMLHAFATCSILYRVVVKKNAHGISRKTQELLLFVLVLKYMDVATTKIKIYWSNNSTIKIFFLSSSVLILIGMYRQDRIRSTYRPEHDAINHWTLIFLPCLLFVIVRSVVSDAGANFREIQLSLSVVLESVALIPQADMIRKCRQVENPTGGTTFLLAMGMYRGFFLLDMFFRAITESSYHLHYLACACAVVQMMIGVGGAFYRDATALLPRLRYRDSKLGCYAAVLFLFWPVIWGTIKKCAFIAYAMYFYISVLLCMCSNHDFFYCLERHGVVLQKPPG